MRLAGIEVRSVEVSRGEFKLGEWQFLSAGKRTNRLLDVCAREGQSEVKG